MISYDHTKNINYCTECRKDFDENQLDLFGGNKEPKIIEEFAGYSRDGVFSVSTHYLVCSGCKDKSGPWVKADDHWSGGWI